MKRQLLAGFAACIFPLAAIAADDEEQGWNGSVEAGLQYSTGNTESEDFNVGLDLNYLSGAWKHEFEADAANSKENGQRTDEEYSLALGTNYDYSERAFAFGDFDYVKDRFSGYTYRMSEVIGLGYTWVDVPYLNWKSQVGGGFQHTETVAGDAEDSPLARFENTLDIVVTETTDFLNVIRYDAADISTLETETSLKNKITDSLFLKLSLETQTLSDVPAGTKKTDTDTTINIAYEF